MRSYPAMWLLTTLFTVKAFNIWPWISEDSPDLPKHEEGEYVLAVDKAIDDFVDHLGPSQTQPDTTFTLLTGFFVLAIVDFLVVLFRRLYIPKL